MTHWLSIGQTGLNVRATLLTVLASSMLLSGCYSTGGHVPDLTRFPESVPSGLSDFNKEDQEAKTKEVLPVAKRLALSDAGATKLYSFKAMGQSLRVSLSQFAEANKLNIIFDQDVAGVVNVEFHDVTLEQALDSILGSIGLGWIQEDGVIRITREVTKIYQVDYLRATRTGSASMTTSTGSSSGASGGSSGGGSSSGSNSISKNDTINFWTDLETEIKSLLIKDKDSESKVQTESISTTTDASGKTVTLTARPIQQVEGRVTINKISGTVHVTASPRRMKVVDAYMQSMLKGINRQVYIEARILDVTLRDDAALGIDWNKVSFGQSQNLTFSTVKGSTGNIITSSAGGAAVLPGTGFANYTKQFPAGFLVNNISAAIQALEEQGTVRVVSQPKVRTLNNQPAVMKVGTERTFYAVTGGTTTTSGGVSTTTGATEVATVVTEGIMLSVTPQISADGLISLDVMPVVNKIIDVTTSANGSTAPVVETKQTSTMVRLKDGETTVIGGLILEEDSEKDRHLPGVGNIPVAGWLFKGKYSNKVRKELVIFITPHLIEN